MDSNSGAQQAYKGFTAWRDMEYSLGKEALINAPTGTESVLSKKRTSKKSTVFNTECRQLPKASEMLT